MVRKFGDACGTFLRWSKFGAGLMFLMVGTSILKVSSPPGELLRAEFERLAVLWEVFLVTRCSVV